MYRSYESFKNQVPDKKIIVEMKKEKISYIMGEDEYRQMAKVKSKDVYAIVYNNQPYIATEEGYFLLNKTNDDFIFIAKANVGANMVGAIVGGIFFGALGGAIGGLNSDSNDWHEMKIDYVNGTVIRGKQVKK